MLITELQEAQPALHDAVLEAAVSGLRASPKTLSPWLFYDERGSRLFDAITGLPEYYLTRTERGIFTEHAANIRALLGDCTTIAELGAGSASKTGLLLREFAAHQGDVLYQPIDVSSTALDDAAETLARQIPGVRVAPQVANYITERYRIERPAGARILALYIGSSIGNFSPDEATGILANLRAHLGAGDMLLLGVDLAPSRQKPVGSLLAAYDDAAGVTAEFNRNVLVRLNRELHANFAVDCFAHRARWNAAASRMEMHLESLVDQTVNLEGHSFTFRAGETIHTENSYKFTDEALRSLLTGAGFSLELELRDAHDKFAVVLAHAD
ncbi:MAG: L-histidine N(alpha)-methyltransferase [Bryocella sp.]